MNKAPPLAHAQHTFDETAPFARHNAACEVKLIALHKITQRKETRLWQRNTKARGCHRSVATHQERVVRMRRDLEVSLRDAHIVAGIDENRRIHRIDLFHR